MDEDDIHEEEQVMELCPLVLGLRRVGETDDRVKNIAKKSITPLVIPRLNSRGMPVRNRKKNPLFYGDEMFQLDLHKGRKLRTAKSNQNDDDSYLNDNNDNLSTAHKSGIIGRRQKLVSVLDERQQSATNTTTTITTNVVRKYGRKKKNNNHHQRVDTNTISTITTTTTTTTTTTITSELDEESTDYESDIDIIASNNNIDNNNIDNKNIDNNNIDNNDEDTTVTSTVVGTPRKRTSNNKKNLSRSPSKYRRINDYFDKYRSKRSNNSNSNNNNNNNNNNNFRNDRRKCVLGSSREINTSPHRKVRGRKPKKSRRTLLNHREGGSNTTRKIKKNDDDNNIINNNNNNNNNNNDINNDKKKNDAVDIISSKKRAEYLGLRLRNLLKLPKAFNWACGEFFYNVLDKIIYHYSPSDFETCFKRLFPLLRTPCKLTRVQWTLIRRALGKPRRFSPSFFAEELAELNRKRNLVRELQTGCIRSLRGINELPKRLVLLPNATTRLTVRFYRERSGLVIGCVSDIDRNDDNNNHRRLYKFVFDSWHLKKEYVPDVDVMFSDLLDCVDKNDIIRSIVIRANDNDISNNNDDNEHARKLLSDYKTKIVQKKELRNRLLLRTLDGGRSKFKASSSVRKKPSSSVVAVLDSSKEELLPSSTLSPTDNDNVNNDDQIIRYNHNNNNNNEKIIINNNVISSNKRYNSLTEEERIIIGRSGNRNRELIINSIIPQIYANYTTFDMVVLIVQLKKILRYKQSEIAVIRRLNTKLESNFLYNYETSEDYRTKYATSLISLEIINNDLLQTMGALDEKLKPYIRIIQQKHSQHRSRLKQTSSSCSSCSSCSSNSSSCAKMPIVGSNNNNNNNNSNSNNNNDTTKKNNNNNSNNNNNANSNNNNNSSTSLQESTFSKAKEIVDKHNVIVTADNTVRTMIGKKSVLNIIQYLTALLLQIKYLANIDSATLYEVNTLRKTMKLIKSKLSPDNRRIFEDCVEEHMSHIESELMRYHHSRAILNRTTPTTTPTASLPDRLKSELLIKTKNEIRNDDDADDDDNSDDDKPQNDYDNRQKEDDKPPYDDKRQNSEDDEDDEDDDDEGVIIDVCGDGSNDS